jgi:putative protease
VSCFKIEGRLKSPQYVAATTQTYRAALDAALAHSQFQIASSQKQDLAQIFSRGFTHGFLDGVDHSELVPALFPRSRGIRMGTVVSTTRRGVVVQVDPVSSNGRMRLDAGQTPLKPGDGVVFDEGRPQAEEQGGRIYEVFPFRSGTGVAPVKNQPLVELTFARDAFDPRDITPGAIVWKTDDPEVRKRLEQSYARDEIARRVPITAHVEAAAGRPLRLTMKDSSGHSATVESQQTLELARKHPLTLDAVREQLDRLGDTPFELADLTARPLDPVMAPKSVLNDLRRRAVGQLLSLRQDSQRREIPDPDALTHLRNQIVTPHLSSSPSPHLTVLCRTLEQVRAVADWQPPTPIATLYCDFEDVRKYREAVPMARERGMHVAVATTRIIKPGEEGLLRLVFDSQPDAILVRNLAGLSFFREEHPDLPLLGDYSLNVANELTASLFAGAGLRRLVPSYDLNWKQLKAMVERFDPAMFEAVIHQHMPMFHMEHCVFCHTLSTGKDYRDCGRPCDTHKVDLKGPDGQPHPLIADVGCRNTVYNAAAQSAAELVPNLRELGVGLFRVELLRQSGGEAVSLLTKYADLVAGRTEGKATVRSLRVLSQLGVTRGTLEYE